MQQPVERSVSPFAHITCALLFACSPALGQIPGHATQLNTIPLQPRIEVHQIGDVVHAWASDIPETHGYYFQSPDGGRSWPVVQLAVSNFPISGGAIDGDRIVLCGSYQPTSASGGPAVVTSDDGGSTWSQPTLVASWNSTTAGASPFAAVHLAGAEVSLLWTEPASGSIWAQHSSDGGQTWPNAKVLLRQDQPQIWPLDMPLELLSDGVTLRAFWWVATVDSSGANVQLGWQQSSTDDGQTWLATPLPAQPASHYRQTANGSDIYCTSGGETQFYPAVHRSSDGGISWNPIQLGQNAFSRVTDIAVDGNTVAVVGTDNGASSSPAQWTVAVSLDGGSTWRNPALQVAAPFSGYTADVEVVGDDLYVLFYLKLMPIWGVLAHSNDGGNSWRSLQQDIGSLSAGAERAIYIKFVDPTPGSHQDGYHMHAFTGHGWTPLGSGTVGTGGIVPELTMRHAPLLGEGVDFELRNTVGNALGVLGLSLEGPLATPFANGTLWLQAPLVTNAMVTNGAAGVPGAGSAIQPFLIPNSPAAMGARITCQGVVLDPASTNGLALTRGLEVWIR